MTTKRRRCLLLGIVLVLAPLTLAAPRLPGLLRRGYGRIRVGLGLDPPYNRVNVSAEVGERYVIRVESRALTYMAIQEIKAKTDRELTVAVTVDTHGAAEPVRWEHALPLHLSPGPPKPEPRVLGSDTLVISGVIYECRIVEAELPGQRPGKSWLCDDRFPGLIRQVDAGGDVVYELVEVRR